MTKDEIALTNLADKHNIISADEDVRRFVAEIREQDKARIATLEAELLAARDLLVKGGAQIEQLCCCLDDTARQRGGWAWEEVIGEAQIFKSEMEQFS